MSTWGVGNFENDIACKWTFALDDYTDLAAVERALDMIFLNDYFDSVLACEALAAIETIARLRGNYGEQNEYTETVDNWVDRNPQTVDEELVEKAIHALEKIASSDSELNALWEATDDYDDWISALEDVRSRIIA